MATLALFLALGGSAIAVKGAIDGDEIEKRSIPSNRLKANSLGGKQVKESKLRRVRSAREAITADTATTAATAGSAESATNAENAENAATLDGQPLPAFLRYEQTVPSGTTITGSWGGGFDPPGAGTVPDDFYIVGSFPVTAPSPIPIANVNFASDSTAITTDDDPSCTGSPDNPTAPPGKVCVYRTGSGGSVAALRAFPLDASRHGFTVEVAGSGTSILTAFGTWAYTAP